MFIEKTIKGMDVSTLVEEEKCGARFFDEGQPGELFDILQKNGVNSVRLRLWNNPYDETGKPYGAGTNDFETTVNLAKRAKAHDMSVLLDFHYSDFWADPGKQYPPKAWAGYSAAELVKAVYDYTKEVLLKLKEQGLLPYMVQVGNELTNGTCWPLGNRHYGREEQNGSDAVSDAKPYFNPILKDMLTAGIRAVREVLKDIIVMIHLDNGGNNELYRDWFDGFYACSGAGYAEGIGTSDGKDDFDVIGLSYYPFWHGNFEALRFNMDDIASRYGKELVVAEVSMGHTMEDYRKYELKPGESIEDYKGMATREELIKNLDYPMTVDGQVEFMKHLNKVLADVPGGLGKGYYYWEPAWIPVPGCGWATEEALLYIHEKGPCGNEWANQALFDYNGNALPALKI